MGVSDRQACLLLDGTDGVVLERLLRRDLQAGVLNLGSNLSVLEIDLIDQSRLEALIRRWEAKGLVSLRRKLVAANRALEALHLQLKDCFSGVGELG